MPVRLFIAPDFVKRLCHGIVDLRVLGIEAQGRGESHLGFLISFFLTQLQAVLVIVGGRFGCIPSRLQGTEDIQGNRLAALEPEQLSATCRTILKVKIKIKIPSDGFTKNFTLFFDLHHKTLHTLHIHFVNLISAPHPDLVTQPPMDDAPPVGKNLSRISIGVQRMNAFEKFLGLGRTPLLLHRRLTCQKNGLGLAGSIQLNFAWPRMIETGILVQRDQRGAFGNGQGKGQRKHRALIPGFIELSAFGRIIHLLNFRKPGLGKNEGQLAG